MNIEQRLGEVEKTIDAIALVLTFLINPSKKVDHELLGEKINSLEQMIKNRARNKEGEK